MSFLMEKLQNLQAIRASFGEGLVDIAKKNNLGGGAERGFDGALALASFYEEIGSPRAIEGVAEQNLSNRGV